LLYRLRSGNVCAGLDFVQHIRTSQLISFALAAVFSHCVATSTLTLTGNCTAYALEVHNGAGTPVIQTDTLNDRQVNILFISLQYYLFPQPGYYIKHNLLQCSSVQQIKGLLKHESLNILHPNVCILAKC